MRDPAAEATVAAVGRRLQEHLGSWPKVCRAAGLEDYNAKVPSWFRDRAPNTRPDGSWAPQAQMVLELVAVNLGDAAAGIVEAAWRAQRAKEALARRNPRTSGSTHRETR